ncbi:MAG: selenocysteine-specific translation elongation factor [Chloroflexi bacterium]|nr:selenocysteine-specific translation elongation factor [Chloroflexota bacterium]
MFVLGTAGHIDHGKSALVKALTGIDPDRLREEKERGMTIDLGFAWLKLPSGREVGIVDVPGHERFIKNMLAGVGGIDLAMLVIAANDSVRPQTREHLAILDLLEVRRGIIVITKRDLVDDDWLGLVKMEIEELVKPTTLAQAPMVAVSALTGAGLPELLATIDRLLDTTPPRKDIGRPRLPIDRVFSIAGSGTVVTGTLIDGSLALGQEVEIVPSALKSRVRGLQTHKTKVEAAEPGSRVAANLVGVTIFQLQRGDVVTTPGWLSPTTMLTGKLRMLSYYPRPLRHNAEVSFFTGADETLAKVRLLEGNELKPGETTWVQLLLDEPVAVVKGDHFIIRSTMDTIGGGKIIDAHSKRLRRLKPEVIHDLRVKEEGTAEEVVLALLEAKQPVELSVLQKQCNLPAAEVESLVESLINQGLVLRLGQGAHGLLVTGAGWQRTVKRAVDIMQEYHSKFPVRAGMPKEELRNKLKMGASAPSILQKLIDEAVIIEEKTGVRLPAHKAQLTLAQQAKVDAFLDSLRKNPYSPPSDLIPEPDLLNLLVDRRDVVKVAEGVYFSVKTYDEMVAKVVAHIKASGKVTLGETRDMFQTSRKYAQALLEHLDAEKVTKRVGDERVLG